MVFAFTDGFSVSTTKETDMPPASPASDSPSALRLGLSVGKSVLGGLMLGIFLAIVLGIGTTVFYALRLNGPGMPAAAHAGGAGAIIALVFTPQLWPMLALIFMIPAYVFVGLNIGRAKALGKLVKRYGQGLSQRLADMLAKRIESMPKTHKALHKAADLLTVDAAMDHFKPWLGDGRVVRFAVSTVLHRLPLSELLQEWDTSRSQSGVDRGTQVQHNDAALRAFLGAKIQTLLQDMQEPPWNYLWMLMAVHAVVLGLGIWLTS